MCVALAAILAWALASQAAEPITVSAAASLTDALEAIARDYHKAGGSPVRFNFAGSNVLARQLVNGAPVDLFISADDAQMDVAARAGAVDAATRVELLGNRLAILGRAGVSIRQAADLLRDDIRRVAIGDPEAVPAGVYARRYLEAVDLWGRLQPKFVPVANVRAAVVAVRQGSADAAIVYESDVSLAPVTSALIVTGALAPRIVYPAAIVSASKQRASAERFLAFLRAPAASEVFRSYKFIPLAVVR